jgi:hypothetical protein
MMNATAEYPTEGQRYRQVRQNVDVGTTVAPVASGQAQAQTVHGLRHQILRPPKTRGCARVPTSVTTDNSFQTTRNVSAFSELDALRSDDSVIQAVLTGLRHASPIQYRDRLATRLEQLLAAYKEDSDGHVFSADSLRGLIVFLEGARFLRYPAVTLTRGGDIYASWKRGSDHVFSAQFLKTQQVRFVIFRPNLQNVGQSDQLSGLTTPQSLPSMISHLNVSDWAAE